MIDFASIPPLRMPTDEERKASSAKWLEPLKPCLYTYWPERYKELSFRTWVEVLTNDETAILASVFMNKSERRSWDDGLIAKVTRGAEQFTNGCFFKLESRSPKDNYWGEMTNFRACSWHDVEQLIWSERLLDDLCSYTHADEPLRLLFREWHPIRKEEEFRCFIRNRKLAAISQYHYAEWDEWSQAKKAPAFRGLVARKTEIGAALTEFIEAEIIAHLHVDNLVADLWRDHMGKITLIEVNPYGLSDPCLFTYEQLESADGEFRIVVRP